MCKHSSDKCVKWGLLVLRLAVGAVFIYHGWTKLQGMEGVVGMMAGIGLPVPMFWAWLVALVEFVGGIAIILGLFTNVVTILLAIDMVVALITVHTKMPYKAAELPIVLLASVVTLYTTGAGKLALMRGKNECCGGACEAEHDGHGHAEGGEDCCGGGCGCCDDHSEEKK